MAGSIRDMSLLLRIENARHAFRCTGYFSERLDHEVLGHAKPVLRTRAHIGQRREIASDLVGGAAPRTGILNRRADKLTLDRHGALRRCGHASIGDARRGDAAILDADPKSAEHARDVLVEPFADLERLEKGCRRQFWNDETADEFARLAILLAISQKELFERQRADPLALSQFDAAAECNEQRCQIADR